MKFIVYFLMFPLIVNAAQENPTKLINVKAKKYVVHTLDASQKQFLSTISLESYRELLSLIVPIMNKSDFFMKSLIDVFSFCKSYDHKNQNSLEEIHKWIDKNNDFSSCDLKYIKEGLCLCNIFQKNSDDKYFENINWENFANSNLNKKKDTESPVKDLRKKAFSIILNDIESARESARTGEAAIKKETLKIINACTESKHQKFKDLILEWSKEHNIKINSEWCMCDIFCRKTESMKQLTDVTRKKLNETKSFNTDAQNKSESICCNSCVIQ